MPALRTKIDAALGTVPADIVIKNIQILDLNTGKLTKSDIAISGNTIVGTYDVYQGKKEIDGKNQIAVPGFIDAHLHVESSMLTPYEFERCALPLGTTTAACDPHELANVCGIKALEYFLACAEKMKMDLYVNLSSCVPSTHLETSGAVISATDLKPFKNHPKSLGLAEFMNVPGVLYKNKEALAKIEMFEDKNIDGHAPLLSAKALNAYLACGVTNDHETSSLSEAKEKLAKGMRVFIREGGVAKNLNSLAPLVQEHFTGQIAFCTDDRTPLDVAHQGHINYLIAKSITLGVKPHIAYKTATFSAALALGLKKTGFIAPGYQADIVLVSNLKKCKVTRVFKNGQPVDAKLFASRPKEPSCAFALGSFKCAPVTEKDFEVHSSTTKTSVIGVIENSLITKHLKKNLPIKNARKEPILEKDILKTAVIGRHRKENHIGLAFVHGFGLTSGAMASSVAHDSHNICVIGTNDKDMCEAVNEIIRMPGGQVTVRNGKVLARLPLPVGGLMTLNSHATTAQEILKLKKTVQTLGCRLEEPFLQMAFLQLPAIAHLKLTDFGLVDVERFELLKE